eukprot:289291-Pyramimonas_sp.AAC.1
MGDAQASCHNVPVTPKAWATHCRPFGTTLATGRMPLLVLIVPGQPRVLAFPIGPRNTCPTRAHESSWSRPQSSKDALECRWMTPNDPKRAPRVPGKHRGASRQASWLQDGPVQHLRRIPS